LLKWKLTCETLKPTVVIVGMETNL